MSGQGKATNDAGAPLALPSPERIAEELRVREAGGPADDIEVAADGFVDGLLQGLNNTDGDPRERVDDLGVDAQREAAHRSDMLREPIRRLAHQGDEGGPVATTLLDLRQRMQQLDPREHTLANRGLARLLSWLPGVGTPLQRYFRRFESAQEALDAILRDLESGREMLRRDNLTLADDQAALREALSRLRGQVALGRRIDERLQEAAAGCDDEARRSFIEEELLFPLRQRVTDLQQQLAVSQQGILALEVVIRNNRELMRGVTRAANVTVSALNVAVTVALGLANQRLVLDRVEALNASTADMIAGTAQTLKTQGAEIQNRAASSVLDMERLEGAFRDVLEAIDAIANYRREALPTLDDQIDRLERLTAEGDAAIERLDRGNASDTGASV